MRIKFLIIALMALSCKSKKTKEQTSLHHPQFMPGPHALVYKTTKDYSQHVPVILDDSGRIVSYYAPSDFKTETGTIKPIELNKGYWLDQKGIGLHVAYLNWTIDEYVKMDTLPSLSSMQNQILDKKPLTEICDCGNTSTYTDMVKQINDIIEQDSLKSICRELKP